MVCLDNKTLWNSYYVTSVDFNSKKIHEDKMVGRQDITIFLRSIQRLQICKIPKHEIGTLTIGEGVPFFFWLCIKEG